MLHNTVSFQPVWCCDKHFWCWSLLTVFHNEQDDNEWWSTEKGEKFWKLGHGD